MNAASRVSNNAATSSTFMHALELSWREDKEDNWEALLQGDLQRRYDTRVGRCFQTVCVFCALISYGFVLIFFFLTHSVLLSP